VLRQVRIELPLRDNTFKIIVTGELKQLLAIGFNVIAKDNALLLSRQDGT
jgi:hypothetical protein